MPHFILSTTESQRSKRENTTWKLKSSAVVYWTSYVFQLPRSQFKGDADSCPPHLLWPRWEWRVIKLLTTGEERQDCLDTSQPTIIISSTTAVMLSSVILITDVKLGAPSSDITEYITLLLMARCELQEWVFLFPLRLCSWPFCFRCFLGGLMKVALCRGEIRGKKKKKHMLSTDIPTQPEEASYHWRLGYSGEDTGGSVISLM